MSPQINPQNDIYALTEKMYNVCFWKKKRLSFSVLISKNINIRMWLYAMLNMLF